MVTEEDTGKLIQYFDQGWRAGMLVEIISRTKMVRGEKKPVKQEVGLARIRPIVSRYATEQNPKCRIVPLEDVKRIESDNGTNTFPRKRK